MKVCDNCGENTNYEVRRPNGEVWCYKCAKIERYKPPSPKRIRTKDSFIKFARILHGIYNRGYGASESILESVSKKRCYTNGYVLVSELKRKPDVYKVVSIDTLQKMDGEYPSFEKARPVTDKVIYIPEDFYNYLKAFNKRKTVRVMLKHDRIEAVDEYEDMSLCYGEDVEGLSSLNDATICVSSAYMLALKPSRISFTSADKTLVVDASYDETVDQLSSVLLMPRSK